MATPSADHETGVALEPWRSQPAVLDHIKNLLRLNPAVYFAGELTAQEDDGSRFDEYDLFVAPIIPTYEPDKLNDFLAQAMTGVEGVKPFRRAHLQDRGWLQMPDVFVDQHVGNRTYTGSTATEMIAGTFKGQSTSSISQDPVHIVKLIQRTRVRAYPSSLFARTMFNYCDALMRQELDEKHSVNLAGIYGSHGIPADQLAAVRDAEPQHTEAVELLLK